jgi:uncharacterized membrane protein
MKAQQREREQNMTPIVWTYFTYLLISVSLTVWVAKTLHKNGRIFLVDSFRGNEPIRSIICLWSAST